MDIDATVAETHRLREAKRQIQASQALLQVLRSNKDVSESDAELLAAVLTRIIREPLEEKLALQQEQIAFLRQQVDFLIQRVGRQMWP